MLKAIDSAHLISFSSLPFSGFTSYYNKLSLPELKAGLFSPGMMLVFAIMPFWVTLRRKRWFKCVLSGLNAVATGMIGAACISLYEMTVLTRADAMVFIFALTMATAFSMSAPLVVISGLIFGAIISQYALSLGQVPYCVTS
jgi:chromate transport protein ChrA